MSESGLAERLHSTAIRLLRHVRGEDAASGLTAARLSALSVLVFGGARTMSELALAEQVAPPTMTRLLQGMERDGYVKRMRDRSDGRVLRVSATPAGRRALERARARRVARLDQLLSERLGTQDRARVAQAVSLLEQALGARPPAPRAGSPAPQDPGGRTAARSATEERRRASRGPRRRPRH